MIGHGGLSGKQLSKQTAVGANALRANVIRAIGSCLHNAGRAKRSLLNIWFIETLDSFERLALTNDEVFMRWAVARAARQPP